MSTQLPKILVTGATGYIGGRLIPALIDQGYSVRCLVRDPHLLKGRFSPEVEMVQGDVLKPETLVSAFEGIQIAYYLIHSMNASSQNFEALDRQAAQNFALAAKQAHIQRIIYLGGLGESNFQLSAHLQSRHEVGDLLRTSDIPVTEFRAAIIVGSGSVSFEMIRYLTERLPLMICPRWVLSRCQPIGIRDVICYLTAALVEPRSIGKLFEIGGSDVLTYKEMMLRYAQVRGLKRKLIEVPVLTPRLSSYWINLVTPIPSSIARPLVQGLKNDVICQDSKAREIFPILPMSYEQAVRLALNRIEENTIETTWANSGQVFPQTKIKPLTLENREGMIREIRKIEVSASPAEVFSVFSGIGGKRGWLYGNWMWKLRAIFDRWIGGVGMRRGRRHPDAARVGDVIDFWRVEEVIPDRLLRLRAEMKVPGKAWLQFEVLPHLKQSEKSILVQTAFFEPKGLGGHLYWYLLYPIHQLIFSGLCRRIREKSEKTC